MMIVVMWIISLVPLIGTLVALRFFPDTVPVHYDFSGNVDRWGSKYEALIFPILIIVMILVWTIAIFKYKNKASNAEDEQTSASARTNAKVLGIIGIAMTVIFTVMHAFLLYGSYKGAVSGTTRQIDGVSKIVFILLGLVLIVLGNFMTKTRNNRFVGFRIKWSKYNDNTWRKTNRFGAFATIIAGLLIIISAILLPSILAMTIIAISVIVISVIATTIYSHKVYVQELESEKIT